MSTKRQLNPFLGREAELNELKRFIRKNSASLIVLRGRRRIGKSRLIQEFGKGHRFYRFAGLAPAPKGVKQPSQLKHFAYQLSLAFKIPEPDTSNWSSLLHLLAQKTAKGRHIVLLDEISWMATDDSEFLSKLQYTWDQFFSNNPQLILILCGSASAWIEKNILSNTGFYGRVSYTLTLDELPLGICKEFWDGAGSVVSAYEKFKILAVTGGIPRYLEEMDPRQSADFNIQNLCYKKGSILSEDFERIFSDIFGKRSEIYRKIILKLIDRPLAYGDICDSLSMSKSGLMSEYLNDLIISGFVSRDYSWYIGSGKIAKLTSRYRLRDNYLRFYLKYIEKHISEIQKNRYQIKNISNASGWASVMGLQFENLVLNNRDFIFKSLGLSHDVVIRDDPFYQKPTKHKQGCQIDYLIQTRFNALFMCEIKFSRNPIRSNILDEMKQKESRLKLPRNFSCFPVLIHVNGVTDSVIDSGYFAEIIDFSEILGSL